MATSGTVALCAVVGLTLGSGTASAARTLAPEKFGFAAALTQGTLKVDSTNSSENPAACQVRIYSRDDFTAVKKYADAFDDLFLGNGNDDDVAAAAAEIKVNHKILTADSPIPVGESRSVEWNSELPDSSYTVLQWCTSGAFTANSVQGTRVKLVSGTGKGGLPISTGSLGSLFPGL